MKNIVISVVILILIPSQSNGQQSQNTLHLKNGDKAVGKLPGQLMTEYRFQSLDGIYFTYSSNEVEKIVATQKMRIRKANLDTLTTDELNLFRDKASNMRTAGMIMTLAGIPIYIAGVFLWLNYALETPAEERGGFEPILYSVMTVGGVISTIAGINLWTIGSRRMKAEVTLKAYNIKTDNSMAVGLGITMRF